MSHVIAFAQATVLFLLASALFPLSATPQQAEAQAALPTSEERVGRLLAEHNRRLEMIESARTDDGLLNEPLFNILIGALLTFLATRLEAHLNTKKQGKELTSVLAGELSDNFLELVKVTPEQDRDDITYWKVARLIAVKAQQNTSDELWRQLKGESGKLKYEDRIAIRKAYAKRKMLIDAADHALPTIDNAVNNGGPNKEGDETVIRNVINLSIGVMGAVRAAMTRIGFDEAELKLLEDQKEAEIDIFLRMPRP